MIEVGATVILTNRFSLLLIGALCSLWTGAEAMAQVAGGESSSEATRALVRRVGTALRLSPLPETREALANRLGSFRSFEYDSTAASVSEERLMAFALQELLLRSRTSIPDLTSEEVTRLGLVAAYDSLLNRLCAGPDFHFERPAGGAAVCRSGARSELITLRLMETTSTHRSGSLSVDEFVEGATPEAGTRRERGDVPGSNPAPSSSTGEGRHRSGSLSADEF